METKHKTFKPYDRILVRDSQDKWQIDLYSHWNEEYKQHITLAYGDGLRIEDNHILSYEGHEQLVGTTNEPEGEVKLEEGEHILVTDKIKNFLDSRFNVRIFKEIENTFFVTNVCNWLYAIRFSDFNPNDMEETKKHILCVKNGKVVKFKC